MKESKIPPSKLQNELEQIQSSLASAGSYFHKVHILRSELLPFLTNHNEAKRFSKEIIYYKKQLRENTKKMETELKEVSVSTTIDNHKIQESIEVYLNSKNADEFFRKVAGSFCPKKDEIRANSNENQPIMLSFVGLTVIDEKGNPKRAIEHEDYWYKQNYQIQQGLYNNFINTIFIEAIAKDLIDFEKTCKFIESQPLFSNSSEILTFRRGLERLFMGDFVSALHILVPLYERVIINISELLGIDIIALNQGSNKEASIQDKTIGTNFVNSDEFKEKWKKDFAEQINFILFDDYGYKIRHKIAHGEMEYSSCNSNTCFLILYLYIAIAAKIIIKTNAN